MQTPHSQRTDGELEQLAAAGDGIAFGELYDRHFGKVFDFSFRLLRDQDEAADVAQETFLRAMRALSPGEKSASTTTWLFTIARNLALTRLERKGRTVAIDGPDDKGTEAGSFAIVDGTVLGDPERAALASDQARLVWEASQFLSPKEVSVLDLHLRQGLESADIAEVMGITKGNAYTILSRLKTNLEEAVTALVLVRTARAKCLTLDRDVLDSKTALLSPEIRRLVNQHLETCPTCQEEKKRLLSPTALFGAFAMVPVPLALKTKGAAAMEAEWALHGPPVASNQASIWIHGVSNHFRRLVSKVWRPMRGLVVTWPYHTRRRRASIAALSLLLLLILLFGSLSAGDQMFASERGDLAEPEVTQTPRPRSPDPSPSPSFSPTVSATPTPTPTNSVTPPPPTPTPAVVVPPPPTGTPRPPTVQAYGEPASQCAPSASVPLAGDAIEDAGLGTQLINLTNQRRSQNGLNALVLDDRLRAAAAQHARFVLQSRWWSTHSGSTTIHCQPDGSDMYWRARCAGPPPTYVSDRVIYGTVDCSGYPPAEIGENVAGGSRGVFSAQDVFSWMIAGEEPAVGKFTATGLACFTRNDLHEFACVQVLGGPPLVQP